MKAAHLTHTHIEPKRTAGPLESFQAPPGAGTLGTWLFTAGLTLAFAWLLFGYAVTRTDSVTPRPSVPIWFWFSTFVILVSSVVLHWSFLSARMGRVALAGQALRLATVLGVLFLLLQTPGLVKLVQCQHQTIGVAAASYFFVLAMVSLHGLHVLVGLIRMAVLNKQHYVRSASAYGAARLKQMCLYWHFLAVAWVVMFGVILWT